MAAELKLTDVELDCVFFVERFHATRGKTPTAKQIQERFNLTSEFVQAFTENTLVQKSFAARGIIFPAAEDKFTAKQMHAAAAMLDYTDRRSDEKKLRDLGITTREWATWLQDSEFAAYLRDRSEVMLSNSLHEAHKGLVKGVRNGNVASIKTMYQITGRHDPDRESQVNVRQLLHTFIEVIQKYVKDPIVLHQIATEMSNLASRESYSMAITDNIMGGPPGMERPAIQGAVINGLGPAPTFGGEDG